MSDTPQQTNISESQILLEIEDFISTVRDIGFDESLKSRFKQLLELFDGIYDVDFHYSDYCAVFNELKWEMELMPELGVLGSTADKYAFVDQLKPEQLQLLKQKIENRRAKVTDDLYQFYQQENDNRDQLTRYMANLFRHYSKLLVVRVDLAF